MQFTKYSHSCVRFDDGDRSLVIDPGIYSEARDALDGADAVLITHEHPDHIDADTLRAAARNDSRLRIWAPAVVAGSLSDLGEQVVAVGAGESFQAAGFEVRTFGGLHALIHASVPVVPNIGYLIGGVYHPGDSFFVPPVPVDVLLAPLHAPWSKTSEVMDFVVAVRAPRVHQIHDALLNDIGHTFPEAHVTRIGKEHGIEYQRLEPKQTIDL